jgi:hypothetical protein
MQSGVERASKTFARIPTTIRAIEGRFDVARSLAYAHAIGG